MSAGLTAVHNIQPIKNKIIFLYILTGSVQFVIIIDVVKRECWNRQTGTFEGRVSQGVRVQVPSLAP